VGIGEPFAFGILMKYQDLRRGLSGIVIPFLSWIVGNDRPQVMKYSDECVHVEGERNLILRLEGSGIHHS